MDLEFHPLLAQAARPIAGEESMAATLDRVVGMCTEVVEGCAVAGVSVLDETGLRTVAASARLARDVDELYVELGEGPHDVLRRHDTVLSSDLSRDQRWPVGGRPSSPGWACDPCSATGCSPPVDPWARCICTAGGPPPSGTRTCGKGRSSPPTRRSRWPPPSTRPSSPEPWSRGP
jgi:hypothetical protein